MRRLQTYCDGPAGAGTMIACHPTRRSRNQTPVANLEARASRPLCHLAGLRRRPFGPRLRASRRPWSFPRKRESMHSGSADLSPAWTLWAFGLLGARAGRPRPGTRRSQGAGLRTKRRSADDFFVVLSRSATWGQVWGRSAALGDGGLLTSSVRRRALRGPACGRRQGGLSAPGGAIERRARAPGSGQALVPCPTRSR